ncbi:MAG: hypothetical protein OEO23_08870 [Gemmatimonadota bacterium]|nr:hypothetical protein [Gemmatimonadota bacterium]
MSVQDVGSIGELVAAIGTVAILIYLSIQVRHNSRASNEILDRGDVRVHNRDEPGGLGRRQFPAGEACVRSLRKLKQLEAGGSK